MTHQQGLFRSCAGLAIVAMAATACSSSGDDRSAALDGWERTASWPHEHVVPFDNVATSSYGSTVAWVRRPEADPVELDYWQIAQGDPPARVELPPPDVPVVIPVALAQDAHRWLAVAATRDSPTGDNTGVVVWEGDATTEDRADTPDLLEFPDELDQPVLIAEASAARTPDVSLVVANTGTDAVIWSRTGSDDWSDAVLDLPDTGHPLAALRVAADGDRFVLAAVDEDRDAHLWTSSDGTSWDLVDADELLVEQQAAPGAVTLTPLGSGQLLVAWLGAGGDAGRGSARVTVQTIGDDDLVTLGTIDATLDDHEAYDRIDPTDATMTPDGEVLVVGEGVRTDGTGVPMMWVHDDDEWSWTEQEALANRIDHRFRAVATTADGEMVALLTHLTYVDVEAWRHIE